MRIVFMGTPEIAAAALGRLLAAGHEVAGVFTRQDKPVGRRQLITAPPVKQLALQHGLPVYQPQTLRGPEPLEMLQGWAPQLVVVVAYGRILPAPMLQLPPLGCINLHVSALPRYRGSAPIQWAVLNGDKETGVTVMQMDEGVDTGDVLSVRRFEIGPDETSEEVFQKAARLGAELLAETVEALARGEAKPTPQDAAGASFAPPLTKGMGRFDFSGDAARIHNKIRGLYPWPAAYFVTGGLPVKVNRARLCAGGGRPGQVLALSPLTVACGSGALQLLELVPQGKRAMTGQQWAAGRRLKKGDLIPAEGAGQGAGD